MEEKKMLILEIIYYIIASPNFPLGELFFFFFFTFFLNAGELKINPDLLLRIEAHQRRGGFGERESSILY